ncbi:MAG: hypothetical protein IGS38_18940 [Synechococcales cyanobacterium M58_A2018_015]|nr:hypothetical protein [Synechococcales cyanobacterium M58_A2018_015]
MEPKTGKPLGWFGVLMIATVSGLLVKVLGEPIVQITSPLLEQWIEDAQEWLDDQDLPRQLERWLTGDSSANSLADALADASAVMNIDAPIDAL